MNKLLYFLISLLLMTSSTFGQEKESEVYIYGDKKKYYHKQCGIPSAHQT